MGKIVNLYRHDPFEGDPSAVKTRLMEHFGYDGNNHRVPSEKMIEEIRSLAPELREPFLRYWNTDAYDAALRVGEFSLGELTVRAFLTPIAAFLVMSQLITEPEVTTKRIKRRIFQLDHPTRDACFRPLSYARQSRPKLPGWE